MKNIIIINFHGIGKCYREFEDESEEKYWISENFFECIIDLILYHIKKKQKKIEITFDDSNISDFTIALPLLKKHNIVATFFILATKIGKPGYLSVQNIKNLINHGMIIGSHGMNHVPWTSLDELSLNSELLDSKIILEDITDQKVVQISCPMGLYNKYVINKVIQHGYSTIYTSDKGYTNLKSSIKSRNTITKDYSIDDINSLLNNKNIFNQIIIDLKSTIKRYR